MKIREKSSGSLHKRTHQPGPRRAEALDVSALRGNKTQHFQHRTPLDKGVLTEMLLRNFAQRLAKEKGVSDATVRLQLRLINQACTKILAASRAKKSEVRTFLELGVRV